MKISRARSRREFGAFVMLVSALISSGCATRQPMDAVGLDHFQIDCSRKAEQIRFLESLRSSRDDRAAAGLINATGFWQRYTNPDDFAERQQVHSGRSNWIINQKLMRLARDCP